MSRSCPFSFPRRATRPGHPHSPLSSWGTCSRAQGRARGRAQKPIRLQCSRLGGVTNNSYLRCLGVCHTSAPQAAVSVLPVPWDGFAWGLLPEVGWFFFCPTSRKNNTCCLTSLKILIALLASTSGRVSSGTGDRRCQLCLYSLFTRLS